MNKIQKKYYLLNNTQLHDYFPIETVTKGILQIFEGLLGLKFFKVETTEVTLAYSSK